MNAFCSPRHRSRRLASRFPRQTLSIVLWVARDLLNHHRASITLILALELLGTLGLGASLAGIISIARLAPDTSALHLIGLKIAIPSNLRTLISIGLAAAGLACALTIYSAQRLCITIAAARFKEIYHSVLAIISSPEHSGWQSVLLPPLHRSLKRLIGSGIRCLSLTVLRFLKAIYPGFIMILALSAMAYISLAATLVLVPLAVAYSVIISRINEGVIIDRQEYLTSTEVSRRNVSSFLDEVGQNPALDQSSLQSTGLTTEADLEKMSKLLFRRQAVENKIKNINNGVFFTVVLILLAYLALRDGGGDLSIEMLIAYVVVLHLAFKSLNSVLSTLAFISSLSPDVIPVMGLLEFGGSPKPKRCTIDWLLSGPDPLTAGLSITVGEFGGEKRQTIFLPRGEPVVILLDEPVNRLTLPSVCFLLERFLSIEIFALFDRASFVYRAEDLELPDTARPLLFASDTVPPRSILCKAASPPDSGCGWIFWVTDDMDSLFETTNDSNFGQKTLCMVISEGALLGCGTIAVVQSHKHIIRKNLKKSRRAALEEEVEGLE